MTPEGVTGSIISPDGKRVVTGEDGKLAICPLDGGAPRLLKGVEPEDRPLEWSPDGRWLYVRPGRSPAVGSPRLTARVSRIDVETGRREAWTEFHPTDSSGMTSVSVSAITPDGKSLAFTYARRNSDLYVVNGWK